MIMRISEISGFLNEFERYAHLDGTKYFLTLNTISPNGTLTIMKYPNGNFTYHRKNENYWDIKEINIEMDMLSDIVWGFRKTINETILASTLAH
jgi:hypothetical protein